MLPFLAEGGARNPGACLQNKKHPHYSEK